MKTVLQINTNVGYNSTGRIAEELGRMAIDAGWESYIAYGRQMMGQPQSASRLIQVGNRLDNIFHGAYTRLLDRHGLVSTGPTKDLIRNIDQLNPDVIHLHNIHGYYLNYQELFAYLSRIDTPVVWTLHDCWAFTGHCAYFSMASCDRWRHDCHHCPLKSTYPASLLLDNSAQNHRLKRQAFTSVRNLHIVTVSDWLKDIVEQSFLGRYPVYSIHNGIDLPRIKPSATRSGREKIVLAAASKWDVRKGLDDIVALRAHLPADYRIKVVGLSASQIRQLPAGIEGLRRINERETMHKIFADADVFINPSLSETLSITNLEAQGCGKPVVAYDSGGMPETITKDTGIIVPVHDVEAMAAAVCQIIDNPGKYTPEACRENVRRNFSRATNFSAYIDLYESLVRSEVPFIPAAPQYF